jgi:glycosyltransferase involved in cell wall biosynthesis
MRILVVSTLWPPHILGGAEVHAEAVAHRLSDAGHEVGAVTLGYDGDFVVGTVPAWPYPPHTLREQPAWKRFLAHGVDLYRPSAGRRLREIADRFQPDVVHTNTVQGFSVAALMDPAGSGVGHVHQIHDYWLLCARTNLRHRHSATCGPACAAIRRLRRTLLERHAPDAVVAGAQAVFDEHDTRGVHLHGSQRTVIKLPVEPPAGGAPERPERPMVFGFIGQVNPNKGITTLLEAFRRAGIEGSTLRVAGRGRLEDQVTGRERDGIFYDGFVSDDHKERFFADIDCMVIPSEWPEPSGIVINEAKVRGLPVIGAQAGGIPEYVPAASRPLLFPSGDVDALVASMRAVAEDPKRYAPVPSDLEHDWDDHLARITRVYEQVRR